MSWRSATGWTALFLTLAIVGGGLRLSGCGGGEGRLEGRVSARIVRVVDGDTVVARVGDATERVRYIGVDTPESVKPDTPVECFAKQAAAANRRLVDGRRVTLLIGREGRDRYGRLLAYVFVGGSDRSVNATLVARGFGHVLTIPPNDSQAPAYRRLERRARERAAGLWGACGV